MADDQWWFDLKTHSAVQDSKAGRSVDRLGPYRTREEAERALEKVEASQVAALLYLEPLVTLGAAAALLGEPIRLVTVAGGALVLAGVLLVQRA